MHDTMLLSMLVLFFLVWYFSQNAPDNRNL